MSTGLHPLGDRVDVDRVRGRISVGLRDSALLALLSAGLTYAELERLRGTAIRRDVGGHLVVVVVRRGLPATSLLGDKASASVRAWLAEREIWGQDAPVFGMSARGIGKVVERYKRRAG